MDDSNAEVTFVTQWNGDELIELCKQKHDRDIEAYWNSLIWHNELAEFFAGRAIEAWDESTCKITFHEKAFACEAYVVACVQSLNPMADMLGQIINIAVLEVSHNEHELWASEISKKLQKKEYSGIKDSWDKFYKSDEFRYVNAFSNTIKHRRLVRTKSIQFDITGTHEGGGNVFMPFKYNKRDYPSLTVSTIVNKYRQEIRGFVLNTGASINDHLKSL
jgi:hypothetical protein